MQLTLDPIARDGDPVTSHLAAEAAHELQNEHHRAILSVLHAYGPCGKDRIAQLAKLTGTQVARRTVELERKGLIKPTGCQVMSYAGRMEREWQLA